MTAGPDEEPAPPPKWDEIFVHLAQEYGWTFDQIARMSFEQILIARNGKLPRPGIPVETDDDVMRAMAALAAERERKLDESRRRSPNRGSQ